jgi:hypothetical protein
MHLCQRTFCLILILSVCLLVLVVGLRSGQAREPFFDPDPPIEAYDFARAADSVKLRGLLITEDSFRAVVYVETLPGFRVLSPMDRLEVTLDDLRHEFQVVGLGGRNLILRGQDDYRYKIGVEQVD